MRISPEQPRTGFTLVEVMIVVVILGILAAIVIPQFTSADEQSRANSVQMDLYRIRQQIEVYKQYHSYPPSLEDFAAQMTQATDMAGNTAPLGTDGFNLGPYLSVIPRNPYTDTNDVADIGEDPGTSAWVYDEETGEFFANSAEEHREW